MEEPSNEKQGSQTTASTAQKEPPKLSDEKMTNWRTERQQFLNALRAGKQAKQQKDVVTDLAEEDERTNQPEPGFNSNMKQCPHCQRTFNAKAADRHIAICANTKHKPKPPPSKQQVEQRQNQKPSQKSPFKSQRKTIDPVSQRMEGFKDLQLHPNVQVDGQELSMFQAQLLSSEVTSQQQEDDDCAVLQDQAEGRARHADQLVQKKRPASNATMA